MTKPTEIARRTYKIDEVAKLLGIGRNAAYEAAGRGEIPALRLDFWRAISASVANQILDQIELGLPDGRRYSPAAQATDRAAWPLVQAAVPTLTEAQSKLVIVTWIKNGLVESRTYHDPIERKDRSGLFVNPAKRPGEHAPV